ncbi:AAA-ATPase At4g25835-like [Cryptomeria japonica]|uniref:AAA-ATPase At4g25835-like n=1 Tax=Cryptomeria japonica TaxID=3369 RepID=UPI0027D9FA48|nr:AAA-ATPase At4g25835-like [Cryptomeria japonica]
MIQLLIGQIWALGTGILSNELFDDALIYYSNLNGAANVLNQTAHKATNSTTLNITADFDQQVCDSFRGLNIRWTQELKTNRNDADEVEEKNSFLLKADKAALEFFTEYFEHVARKAEELRREKTDLTIATNTVPGNSDAEWTALPFNHPSTFNTVALNPSTKEMIISDLESFKQAKNFCIRTGRAWKRGYLLYGPPGTGKTSLIADIANYMNYSVYDLDLTHVKDNVELRKLLIKTKEKSIIIVEDIDCSIVLNNEPNDQPKGGQSRVTLSGLLNFTDGLWSSCGDERLFIFTTNHKDHLDPALCRCGRMDVHINLSYCDFPVFKTLAYNYLRIEDHALFSAVQERISAGAKITPAEITEILSSKPEDANKTLSAVIVGLDKKIKDKEAKSLTTFQPPQPGGRAYPEQLSSGPESPEASIHGTPHLMMEMVKKGEVIAIDPSESTIQSDVLHDNS